MKPSTSTGLLAHEIFFGTFLVLTLARFIGTLGLASSEALLYLGLIAVNVVLIGLCVQNPSPWRWRVRLLFYVAAMNIIYFHMKTAIPRLQPHFMDSLLENIDSLVIGKNLSLRLQDFTHPVLTEFFSLCYILFFPCLAFNIIYYLCSDLESFKKFCAGVFTIYGLGFLGYSLLPATGPHVAMAAQFSTPLHGWGITRANAALVAHGSNGVDVFPSLHCAISSFLLFFDRRRRPWWFKLYLVPCVGLWISTIYLRYHYLVDVFCGLALAAFALWIANRTPSRPSSPAVAIPETIPQRT